MVGIAIERIGDEPIVPYGAVPGYGPIFNAGAILHDGRFHLFARGVRDHYRRNGGSGARFLDYVSDILVFTSPDGRLYEFQQVLAEGAPDGIYSWEDPRVHLVRSGEDEHFVMSYTNLPAAGRRTSSGGSASTGSATPTAASRSTTRRAAWSARPASRTRTGSSSTSATAGSR